MFFLLQYCVSCFLPQWPVGDDSSSIKDGEQLSTVLAHPITVIFIDYKITVKAIIGYKL